MAILLNPVKSCYNNGIRSVTRGGAAWRTTENFHYIEKPPTDFGLSPMARWQHSVTGNRQQIIFSFLKGCTLNTARTWNWWQKRRVYDNKECTLNTALREQVSLWCKNGERLRQTGRSVVIAMRDKSPIINIYLLIEKQINCGQISLCISCLINTAMSLNNE